MPFFRSRIAGALCTVALSLGSICHASLDVSALSELIRENSQLIIDLERELAEITADKEAAKENRDRLLQLRREIAHHKSEHNKTRSACHNLLRKIQKNGNINTTDEQKRTLLMLVAAMGIDAATQMILQEKPDLSRVDKNNRIAADYERSGGGNALSSFLRTEWDTAISAMHQERIEELLNCGADPNWPAMSSDMYGNTLQEAPHILALQAEKQDIFYLLINYGASVEARSRDGIKMAELIVRQGNAYALSAILEKGCKTNIPFADGRPMFEHLLAPGAEECLNIWLSKAEAPQDSASYLNLIARRGTKRAVELVFARNSDALNAEDSQNNIPLHEAARRGDVDIYNTLLQLGADPQGTNMRGETSLMHAALSGSPEMLQAVLQRTAAAQLEARDEKGHTAIHFARLAKDTAAEQALRAAGLSPSPSD